MRWIHLGGIVGAMNEASPAYQLAHSPVAAPNHSFDWRTGAVREAYASSEDVGSNLDVVFSRGRLDRLFEDRLC